MKIKIQKIFALALVLPIVLGFFAATTRAAITCETTEECQVALTEKAEKYNEADALHKAFFECNTACENWTPPNEWSRCSANYNDVSTSCDEIFSTGQTKTGKMDPDEILLELNNSRTTLGGELTELTQKINSMRVINVHEILSVTGQNGAINFKSFFEYTIDMLVKTVGLAAFVFIVIAGFRLLAAAGNDNEIQKAKTMLTYSIGGLVVALLAYIIVAGVQGILYR